ncbi:MAG TPA: BON domain-containing protein [Steroidobacteraceae bacterium]|jgi:osmotically-inducible protein OsmY|nr:BON domain-containing protein [Steroidobacteraceae bacterium]
MPLALRSRIVAAILASSAALSACAGVPARSAAQLQADATTANGVYVALNDDPIYFFRHVEVSVDNGAVHLSGLVWTADAIYRAQQIALSVPGATRVVNHLELERASRTGGQG